MHLNTRSLQRQGTIQGNQTLLHRSKVEKQHQRQFGCYRKFSSGRNHFVVIFVIGRLVFKFCLGIFDEVSDWWYLKKNEGNFEHIIIEELMWFFLVAQFVVQWIAWAIIIGQLLISEKKRQSGKSPLINIKQETKSETNVFKGLFKFIGFNIYNLLIFLVYVIKASPLGFLMMVLQVTKISPFLLHYYFQNQYSVVLTQDLFRKLQEKRSSLKKNKQKFSFHKAYGQEGENKLLLNANISPNWATFFFEADLERYLRMADTIEAIFEALPMSILQYINNQMNKGSIFNWPTEDFVFFLSSFMTVLIYTVSLIQYLFQEDSETLWNLRYQLQSIKEKGQDKWQKQMQHYEKQKQNASRKNIIFKSNFKKQEKQLYLHHNLQMPNKYSITNEDDLLKFQYCVPQGMKRVQELTLDLQGYAKGVKNIVQAIGLVFDQCFCNNITLKLNYCNVKLNHFSKLLKYSTGLNTRKLNYEFEGNDIFENLVVGEQTNEYKERILENFRNIKCQNFNLNFSRCNISDHQKLKFIFDLLSTNQDINEYQLDLEANNINCTMIKNFFQESKQPHLDTITSFNLNMKDNWNMKSSGMSTMLKFICVMFQNVQKLQINFSNSEDLFDKKDDDDNQQQPDLRRKGSNLAAIMPSPDFETLKEFQQDGLKFKFEIENQTYLEHWAQNIKQISFDLYQNYISNEGLKLLGDCAISQFFKLRKCQISASKQKRDIGAQGINYIVSSIPKQVVLSEITLNFKYNKQLQDTLFNEHKLLIQSKNGQSTKEVLDQIEQVIKLNNTFLKLKTIKLPNQQQVSFDPSFKQGEELWVNFDFNQILYPENKDQQSDVFCVENIQPLQNNNSNTAMIGRQSKQQETKPDVAFINEDTSVSRKQAQISYNKAQNNYYMQCLASNENCSSFRIGKKKYYQLFENCQIQLGRGQSCVYIEIIKIGLNNYIPQELFQERSSKKGYFWEFIEQKDDEQVQEVDEDATDPGTEEEDEDQKIELSQSQILIKVSYQNRNEIETKIYQIFDNANMDKSTFSNQQTAFQQVMVEENQIKIGISKTECDVVVTPGYNQDDLADLHCILGFKSFEASQATDNQKKGFWFIKVPDELDVNKYETFLNLQKTKGANERPQFPLMSGMELNIGFTVFEIETISAIKHQESLQQSQDEPIQNEQVNLTIKRSNNGSENLNNTNIENELQSGKKLIEMETENTEKLKVVIKQDDKENNKDSQEQQQEDKQ